MWSPYHTPARAKPTGRGISPALLLALLIAVVPCVAAGQEVTADTDAAPFADVSHGLRAHQLVEGWVQAGKVLGKRPDPILVDRVLGVRITLRMQGHLLGFGDAWRDDLDALLDAGVEPGPTDLSPLIQNAAFAAFAASRRKLQDAAQDAMLMARLRPELRGAGEVPTLDEIANAVTVDVQIAHHPETITLAPPEPREALLGRFAPGYHGLIARWRGNEAPAIEPANPPEADALPIDQVVVWPATALSHNLLPESQARRLAARLPGLKFHEVDRLGRPGGPMLVRFDVVHVARPRPGLRANLLIRGGALLGKADLVDARLDDMADQMASHLRLYYVGRGLVRGTYHPSTDRYEPEFSTLSEAMLGTFALTHHLNTQDRVGQFEPQAGNIAERCNDLLQRAAGDLDAKADPLVLTPDAAGLMVLTRLNLRGQRADPLSRRFLAALLEGVDDEGLVYAEAGNPRPATRAATAIVALALGRHALATDDGDTLALSSRVLAQLWQNQPLSDGNALPWLAMCVESVEPALVDAGLLDEGTADQRRALLSDAVDRMEAFQVIEDPTLGPADVIGGFVFPTNPPAPPGAPPNPKWSTAPLLSFLATTMRSEGPDAHDPFGRIITAQYAARFLAQLMFDAPSCYYVRAREVALGGVRPALYDNRLSITPTAMSLIAVNELRTTLKARTEAQQKQRAAAADQDATTEVLAEPDASP